MKTWAIILFILIGIGAAALGIWYKKYVDRLIAEGKYIRRKGAFQEYREVFLLRQVTMNEIFEQFKAVNQAGGLDDLHLEANLKNGGIQMQSAMGFTAQLVEYEPPAERSDVSVFAFSFRHFEAENGRAKYALAMNRLLTETEKIFLRLDRDTLVRSVKMSFTKTS